MHLAKALFSFLAAVMAAAGAVRADSQSIVVRADATAISGVVSESNLAVLELNDPSASPNLCPVASHNRIALPAVPTRKTCLWATNPRVPSVGRAELVELPMTYTRHRGALRYLTEGRIGLIRLSNQSERESVAVTVENDGATTLLVFSRNLDELFLKSEPDSVALPGRVLDLQWFGHEQTWAALCASPAGTSIELVHNTNRVRVEVTRSRRKLDPNRIAVVGETILVMSTGYDVERRDGASVTAIEAVYPRHRQSLEPVMVGGTLFSSSKSVLNVGTDRLCVATAHAARGSATATVVGVRDRLAIEQVVALASAASTFHGVVNYSDDTLFLASGPVVHRVEFGGGVRTARMDSDVRDIAWVRGQLAVAEGNRVHVLDPAGLEITGTMAIRDGLVSGLQVWDHRPEWVIDANRAEPIAVATSPPAVQSPSSAGRVLVIPSEGGADVRALRRLFGGAAVHVTSSPQSEVLSRFSIVAVSLEDALAGRISRVALERYTAEGGGLLIVAPTALVSRVDDVREWLEPFRMDVRSAASVLRAVQSDCDWCEVWRAAGLRDGFLVSVEAPGRATFMPGRAGTEGPMARTSLGLGRVVFLGSDGLLRASSSSRPIQASLDEAVRWLMQTRRDVLDSDGDGLANDIEDLNGNGAVDAGETDPTVADTDGDRVLDGLEDVNGNGRLDPGETDPRFVDTDGDGIPDGADVWPLSHADSVAASGGRN